MSDAMTLVQSRDADFQSGSPLRVTILGATGSIGSSTLDLVEREPDRYQIQALTANGNAAALAKMARKHGAKLAVVADVAASARAL